MLARHTSPIPLARAVRELVLPIPVRAQPWSHAQHVGRRVATTAQTEFGTTNTNYQAMDRHPRRCAITRRADPRRRRDRRTSTSESSSSAGSSPTRADDRSTTVSAPSCPALRPSPRFEQAMSIASHHEKRPASVFVPAIGAHSARRGTARLHCRSPDVDHDRRRGTPQHSERSSMCPSGGASTGPRQPPRTREALPCSRACRGAAHFPNGPRPIRLRGCAVDVFSSPVLPATPLRRFDAQLPRSA